MYIYKPVYTNTIFRRLLCRVPDPVVRTECRCRLVSLVFCWSRVFSRPRGRLSRTFKCFILGPFTKCLRQYRYLKVGHDRFLSHRFQFIFHNNFPIPRCVTNPVERTAINNWRRIPAPTCSQVCTVVDPSNTGLRVQIPLESWMCRPDVLRTCDGFLYRRDHPWVPWCPRKGCGWIWK